MGHTPGSGAEGDEMLTVAGIGPGSRDGMTIETYHALYNCDCIVGYTVYVELVRELFPEKEYYTTPMTQEKERCLWAIEQARRGRDVVLVCSGDGGVYGMAGLVYELLAKEQREGRQDALQVRVVPGVTAAVSGAAVLGAPLTNDFAVISLSDRLTPWDRISQRLLSAAAGDLVICLYNPGGKGRPGHLRRACDILLQRGAVPRERLCGVVHNIGRTGQESLLMTLGELREYQADMFTTVYIGNSETRSIGGHMVTPRGYSV